jgi:hypothetical protein
MRTSVLVTTLAIAAASAAFGQDLSSLQAEDPKSSIQNLYEACTGANSYLRLYCIGYISATMESMRVLGTYSPAQAAFGMCPKVSVSYAAGVQAFQNWAQKHPETWSAPRYVGVALALKETWPCN